MTYEELWHRLNVLYDTGEAKALVRWVLDVRFGMSITDIISGKVTYYVPDEDGEIHVLNYPFFVDYPDNTVKFDIDFFGDFGEYYFWNEEYGEYLPEGVNPGDWDPDDPDWDKAKTIDNPKATIGSKMKKRAKLLNKRIGNNKND